MTEALKKLIEQKERAHAAARALPILEKIKIIVELQKLDLLLHPLKGPDDHRRVWQLEN